jgi:hypothetical protein
MNLGSDPDRDRVSSAASELVWRRYEEFKARGWRDADARAEAANGDRDLCAAYSRGDGEALRRFTERQGQAPVARTDLATFGLPTRHYDQCSEVEKQKFAPWLRRLAPGEPEPVGKTLLHKLSNGPDGGLFVLEGA